MNKKAYLACLMLCSAFTLAQESSKANDTNGGLCENDIFSVQSRLFYMNRSFDNGNPDAEALTAGGIFKYETGEYNGLSFGVAYYGSHRLGDWFDRSAGIGTANLDSEGKDIAFIGELYAKYSIGNSMLQIGRQKLSTSLANDHYLRLLPSTYEAVVFKNKDIPNTMLELGYIRAYSGFVSKLSGFDDFDAKWGKDGLGYINIENKSIDNLLLKAQYVKSISDKDNLNRSILIKDYKYLDAKYNLKYGKDSFFALQYGGNNYSSLDDSTMFGASVGIKILDKVDTTLLFNKISGNSFRVIESGPMYTDWQQGYGPYEPSTAIGATVAFKPIDNLSVKLGYVDVSADKNFRADGSYTDDFNEAIIDSWYTVNKCSKLRFRYSMKDQSKGSDREDRDDMRVIYYYNF